MSGFGASKDASVLKISIADKLSNAQAIVADVTQHGDIVWQRFNATPDQILWYYQQMLDLFETFVDPRNTLLHRYRRIVLEMKQLI